MTIDALPTVPSTLSPSTFATDMDTFLGALPTFRSQANALALAMNAVGSGGAFSMPYTFDTATADADPGAGFLRLNNATQNTSTVLRLDLLDSTAVDRSGSIALFDDSTSSVKGYITLFNAADTSKWLLFAISALATPSGYRNVTVSCAAWSAANPFSANDELLLNFTPNGDKGDTGTSGAGVTSQSVGFTLSGGTTSKTLTADVDLTLSAVATLTGSQTLTNKTLTDPSLADSLLTRAMLKDCGATVVDKGNSGTSTQTYDYTAGSVQTSTATGNHTIATSNWPPTGNLGSILIQLTNGGAYAITWPTISWIKPDGTTTTSISTYLAALTGRTALQTSGMDQIMLWSRDAGTTIYGKIV